MLRNISFRKTVIVRQVAVVRSEIDLTTLQLVLALAG